MSLRQSDHRRAAALFEAVLELDDDARARVLDEQCAGDNHLRSEVEQLLAQNRAATAERLAPRADGGGDALRDLATRQTRGQGSPRMSQVDGSRLELSERYNDEGVIGRGGMGEVRALRDQHLGREVAVKTLAPHYRHSRDAVQGFVDEAQITAQLQHPNIVPVHDFGSDHSGNLYFTMKRVQGRTLHELLHDPTLPPGSSKRLSMALDVFLKVCDAVAFAHSRGVLHRDIKPSNIMVGSFGEVYLMDWGVARVQSREGNVDPVQLTMSSDARARQGMVGTPSFLAPEMAGGHYDTVDERSDIFGLGAVLYQIVTGRPPFEADTTEQIIARTAVGNFVPPDELGDVLVPKKLARVIMKAMSLDPGDRYATAGALSDQVREFLHRGLHQPQQTFARGTAIVREGETGDKAYILVRGTCEVFRSVGGVREVLRTIKPGSLFGEGAILADAPRIATVEAVTDVTVLVLSREVLDESFSPDSWEGLLAKTLVERFRELDERMAGLARASESC